MSTPTHSVLNERNWSLLLNAIEERRVVPVIGDALVKVTDEFGCEHNIIDYLMQRLKERFHIEGEVDDFSDIEPYIDAYNIREANIGNVTDIYYEIYEILSEVRITLPQVVRDVCCACRFPLVLTTSFATGLARELGTSADHELVYMKKATSDVFDLTALSSDNCHIYHLFGRANMTRKSYVVTEEDLLDYMHFWHNANTRPRNISSYLSDKFLLVLGCSYPDWLFRFFWHSMKNFSIESRSVEIQGVVSMDQMQDDKRLTQFLSRIRASVYGNASDFLAELNQRSGRLFAGEQAEDEANAEQSAAPARTRHAEIFISYASEDYDIAQQIYLDLCQATGDPSCVWFDKRTLEIGEKYDERILEGIQHCHRFIPIISENTLKPGRRYFKMEWKRATEDADYRGDDAFIIPIILDNIHRSDSRIPQAFRTVHTLSHNDPEYLNQIKRIVRSYR